MTTIRGFMVGVTGLLLTSWSGFAGELILDPGVLKSVSEQARTVPYRSRGGVFSREYFPYELGRPVTPYFFASNTRIPQRRYQSETCCFEVSFKNGSNLVKKIGCGDLNSDLRLPGRAEFKPVRVLDLVRGGETAFRFFDSERTFFLSGYLHSEETVRMDQAVLGLPDRSSFPRQTFPVGVRTQGRVSLDPKNGLQVVQDFELSVGKLGILDSRERSLRNVFSKKPTEWVFTDGAGKVLWVNDLMLPGALQDSLLEVQPQLLSELQGLEERSKIEPVCFRDAGWGTEELGCHRVIGRIPALKRLPYRLLSIDFRNSVVSIIE